MALKLPSTIVTLITAAVGVVAWIIALAGYAAITGKCNDQKGYSTSDCGFNHSLKWLMLVYELVLIILVVVGSLTNMLGRMKTAVVAYITIATALFIYISDDLVKFNYFQENVLKRADADAAYGCAAAGSVLLTMYNLLLIAFVSVADEAPAKAKPTTTIATRQVDLGSDPAPTKGIDGQAPPVTAASTNV